MKNDTKVYVPNGKINLLIDEKTYDKTIGEIKRSVPTTKDKSVHGKQCNICLRKTLLYVHSTSRHFEKRTGRKPYIYKKESYVVCVECIDIIGKIREQKYESQIKTGGIVRALMTLKNYAPTNDDITNYKKELKKRVIEINNTTKIEGTEINTKTYVSEGYT